MTAKPKRALFFVEGNIASGKSTVIKSLEAMGYTVVYEEVDDWKDRYQDVKGNNILGLFYKDMTKWSFAMQIGVIASRFNSLLQAIKRAPTDKPIIVERSLWTDVFVFAANLRLNGHINQIEWSIMIANYNLLFALIEPHLQEFKMRQIYIKTSPHICHQRQMERDRSEERALSDTPQYLVDLHEGHNQWLERENSLGYAAIVNGNQGKATVLDKVVQLLNDK
jgi:deoxyadenosine/deoxycytidine kinase